MIPFNIPCVAGKESTYILEVIKNQKFSGDNVFTKKCEQLLEKKLNCKKVLLTPSGTSALEMSALLLNIQFGDEIIMASYGFTSTANAFVLRGAKIVFVDIRPDTMNIDEKLIEYAINKKTKAIIVMHYAGVACAMDIITEIAHKHNIPLIEDAAQGIMSTYKNRFLGTIGTMGCFSFHETKNIQCGEGGALLINDEQFIGHAEIIREKGTNRSSFFRGEVDKYTWIDVGSSYLPNELSAAFLFAQLENIETITEDRIKKWNYYYNNLITLIEKGFIEVPILPDDCKHNAHIFYIKAKDLNERSQLIKCLKDNGVMAVFHYIPLHSSPAGKKFSTFFDKDNYTTIESSRLIRLPLYYALSFNTIDFITDLMIKFYSQK